ncbi:MAG: PilC/PilY family type IV pilus protein [Candidatus Accumulibacter sp. UW26]|jgi:Tfp pilus tip-associated adhesin PilY1
MKAYRPIASARPLVALLALIGSVHAANTDLALAPLSGASAVQIFPNILFVLDDSGSMSWNYLPDWADPNLDHNKQLPIPEVRSSNAGFNGIAYNPALFYRSPSYFTAAGLPDTTSYPSQTNDATNNWSRVFDNGYLTERPTVNLQRAAYYYTTVAGEYCTDRTLRICRAQASPDDIYKVPAQLRWCHSEEAARAAAPEAGACRAVQTDTWFKFPRMPEPHTSQLTISAAGSVDSIRVAGQEILSAPIPWQDDAAVLATRIAATIEECTFGLVGSCTVPGYRATVANGVVTITAPAAVDATPVLTQVGSIRVDQRFGRWGANQAPGDVRLTVITNSVAAYPKASSRVDCGGVEVATCSYEQEMTNYANWWAYYHTRMQAMKTAASHSFAKIDETRRVGYMSINNNTGSDFLNIQEFNGAQKKDWYDELFAAAPSNNTPLREALSKAGYLYAGKYNQSTLNGVNVTDPVQYYCQKNATILSTDGYWTAGDGFKLDGNQVGDQDSSEVTVPARVERPQLDGGGQVTTRTKSRLLMTTTPTKKQPMKKTAQVRSRVYPMSISTLTVQSILASESRQESRERAKTLQTGELKQQRSSYTKTVMQIQARSTTNGGKNWNGNHDGWRNVDECTTHKQDDTETQCRALAPTTANEVSECAAIAGYRGPPNWKTQVTCTRNADQWFSAERCNPHAECRYDWSAIDSRFKTCDQTDLATGKTLVNFPGKTVSRNCYADWPTNWSSGSECTPSEVKQCQVVAISGGKWTSNDPDCVADGFGGWKWKDGSRRCQANWSAYSQKTDKFDSRTDACVETEVIRCRYGSAVTTDVAQCTPADNGPTRSLITCPDLEYSASAAIGEPILDCTGSTSRDTNGLITIIECAPLPVRSQYVAECRPDEIADATNDYVTTTCTTEYAKEGEIDVNRLVVEVGNVCISQAPVGCPTNDPQQCWRKTCDIEPRNSTPDTLADVAQYYYMTDLRTAELDNCWPNGDRNKASVCGPVTDADEGQRMLTYTLGLGASGLMQYADDYPKAKEGDGSDFASIRWTTTANPEQGICSWQSGGTCDWPPPASNTQTNIDDLWHAAVNGRGTYYSARDPSTLAAGISSALADIGIAKGSLAAVSVISPNFTAGDNSIYEVSFEVGVWAGDLVKRTIDGNSGVISQDVSWSAETQLRKKAAADRTIYTFDSGEKALTPFVWNAISTQQQAYLSRPHIDDLSQMCTGGVTCLREEDKPRAGGENLLAFLRGNSTHEGEVTDLDRFYRQRLVKGREEHRPLGDIAGSEAVYVKAPPWNYVDQQYAQFKAAQKTRRAMVYVGANDGMLHAFHADDDAENGIKGGDEAWAYIPALVFPRLYKLADKNYPGNHQFMVDGTPVMGDICADTAANCGSADSPDLWKTILVGGLNRGGRGYYALDITDPLAPKALWEFSDDNLGYSYGNPLITKLKDGTWVVIVASGYNNTSPGDGQGRLFILNANTGELIRTLASSAGDATTPSGLARISAWANFPEVNNTAERVYGGDLLGNLWRFDVNGDIPPDGHDAHRLATLEDAAGNAQPISTRPELGKVRNHPVVFVGTGKLLGPSDFDPVNENAPKFRPQSFYAIKDRLDVTDYGNPREREVVKGDATVQSFTAWTIGTGTCPPEVSFCKVSDPTVVVPPDLPRIEGETDEAYAARLDEARRQTAQQAIKDAMGPYNDGWYLDLPGDGEQSNTDPSLQRKTLVFTTNRPLEGGGCVPTATSFRYFLDYRTGNAIEGTEGIIGVKIGDFLATRAAVVVLSDDRLYGLTRTDRPGTEEGEIPTPPPGETVRRVSWRELVTE